MKHEQPLPDAAGKMLARFGTQIEYTEHEPHGIVNLAESDVTNDDLRHLVFHPGFAGLNLVFSPRFTALNLNKTLISDAGTKFIGQMKSVESVRLHDTLISDDGLKNLIGMSHLEHLNISCAPG